MSRSPNYKIANGYIQDKTTGKKVGHAVLNRHQLNTTNEGAYFGSTSFQINLASKLYSCCSNYYGIILVYQTFLPFRNWIYVVPKPVTSHKLFLTYLADKRYTLQCRLSVYLACILVTLCSILSYLDSPSRKSLSRPQDPQG